MENREREREREREVLINGKIVGWSLGVPNNLVLGEAQGLGLGFHTCFFENSFRRGSWSDFSIFDGFGEGFGEAKRKPKPIFERFFWMLFWNEFWHRFFVVLNCYWVRYKLESALICCWNLLVTLLFCFHVERSLGNSSLMTPSNEMRTWLQI